MRVLETQFLYMNKLLLSFLLCLILAGAFFSCKDDYENFSTSPNDILSFSHDTLSFDTVLSTIGSATHKIMVYNHNKKPLQISSISLEGAANSSFRINVDGNSGVRFENVIIREKDSLFVFVETTLKENETSNPILILDSIVFITNTVKQQVILQAYGQDAYIYKGGWVIDKDSVLRNDKPYLIYDSLVVNENVSLTLQEGTTIYLHDKTKVDIYGSLKIKGSQEKPVTIRGDRLDKVINIPYDKQPGQWEGIRFYANSYGNEIDYARIRNGMFGILCDSSDVSVAKLTIQNTVLTNVYYNLLEAENCRIEASNSEFSNAGGALVALTGGSYRFVHCTLANYFSSWGMRSGASLRLSNYKKSGEETTPLALQQADFLNCIIYGSNTNEISINKAKEEEAIQADFNYRLDYCLIRMKYEDLSTDHITNYLLNEDPEFSLMDSRKSEYDFRLKEGSPAIDAGSDSYIIGVDMNGILRPQGSGPDIGSYEWMSVD